jgi:hypothetical protein
MKNIIFITFLVFSININAQIILEHTYDSASVYDNPKDQLMIINFEVSGERYVRINREGKEIDIYDMNHSFIKSISYAGFPQPDNQTPSILCLSESLFDIDPKIEFMYIYSQGNPGTVYTRIYNEDGSLIFQADSMCPLILINTPLQQYPIYNTSYGTKMILSNQFTGQAKVYNLPGTLSTSIQEANNVLIAAQSSVSNPYPNPNNGSTQIDYAFPPGVNEGEIVFYDLQGMEIKRFKVDKTFSTLLISTSDLAAGTYYYQLQTSAQNSGGVKMVVIK